MKKLPRTSSEAQAQAQDEEQEQEQAEARAQALPHIHEDLVYQILKLLPAKQVAKLKCLSKSWLSRIEAPDFFDTRGDNKLVGLSSISRMTKLDLADDDSRVDYPLRYTEPDDIDFTLPLLVSSFHGVVCASYSVVDPRVTEDDETGFYETVDVVSLWNPATQDVKVLPPPLLDPKLVHPKYKYSLTFGFGFHAETKDYRVVRVIQNVDRNIPSKSTVEVYSLITDSWRVIDTEVPMRFDVWSNSKRPLEGGGLYFWLRRWGFNGDLPLVAFDFNSEEFEEIPMVEVFGTKPPHSYDGELAVLREKLAYIHRHFRGKTESRYDIWVLNKHGQEVSWTKRHTISLVPHLRPICFSNDGMMVIGKVPEREGASVLYLSDPDSPQELQATPFTCTFSMAAAHKESMVSIGGANGVTYRLDTEWRPDSPNSPWGHLLSQTISAANDNLASRLRENGKDIMIFDGLELGLPGFVGL